MIKGPTTHNLSIIFSGYYSIFYATLCKLFKQARCGIYTRGKNKGFNMHGPHILWYISL